MFLIDMVLIAQALMGAFDNLWHHEWQAHLPRNRGARKELLLHARREALYGALFLGLGWFAWHGWLASLVAAVLLTEIALTLADFLEEDRSRRLPPLERCLHAVLTVSFGLFVGLLAPVLWGWSRQPAALVSAYRGWTSWTFTVFAVAVWTWSVRNALAVRKLSRTRREVPPSPPLRGSAAILIAGATGFVGRALLARLRSQGKRVIVLTRDAKQARGQFDEHVESVERLDTIPSETRIEAIVHLAGARVLGIPWTRARRRQLLESRTSICADILKLVRRLEQRPYVLVAASAVGFYGVPESNVICNEDAPGMPGVFQSDLCAAMEHEAQRAGALDLRVVRLRFGIVLGREDGAYPMQALAARLGFATRLGSGRQPVPWIHLEDAVGMICWALRNTHVTGAVNAVAPEACTQACFQKELAASFGRGSWLAVPSAPLRWLLGEMSTLLLDGQAAVPTRAINGGYSFRYPSLRSALLQLAWERMSVPGLGQKRMLD